MEECTVLITSTTGSLIWCIALLHPLSENTIASMEKHGCLITNDGSLRHSFVGIRRVTRALIESM